MKKRITDNSGNDYEIGQVVKVNKVNGGFVTKDWFLDFNDCEDFDDYKFGDKIKIAKDTYNHGLTDKLVTIKHLTEGYCADGSRSYMTEERMFVPERDFDCYEGETYANKKEEKTTKCQHDEIEPVSPLITRPHDYTGCDPEIAEALKQGLDVYCEVWDSYDSGEHNTKEWVYGYVFGCEYPYIAKESYYLHARAIRQEPVQETKLVPKPASEIFAWLENPENGYRQTVDGKFWEKENEPTFTESMTKYCGRDSLAGYEWHPEWLREVPVVEPEPVSEVSENLPQTATVLIHRAAHLHPGDKVTIIRQGEGGYYLCEWVSGIRIWMRPEQIKFD